MSGKILIVLQELKEAINASLIKKNEWLSLPQTAIEFQLSKSFLYQQTSLKRIPHYKPNGKLIYFRRSEIEQWIAESRVKTITELEAEVSNADKEGRRYGK